MTQKHNKGSKIQSPCPPALPQITVPSSMLAVTDLVLSKLSTANLAVFDLTNNAVSISLAEQMWKEGKPVSAICHGPAAITNVKDPNGKHIVSGRRVTSFSNEEEEQVQLTKAIPYLVETRLKEV
jgi:hypothetical protein